jgi:nucleoside-diphosphate-sugar epimerase
VRVLFIGGTGIISSACVALAVERGLEVTVLNRGRTAIRPTPPGVREWHGDVADGDALGRLIGTETFDAVADFTVFHPDQLGNRLAALDGRLGQYVFISSASAYQTPPNRLPVTESTPLRNPYWEYSRNKIAVEDALIQAYRSDGLPVTIVRPSHTYDRTSIPLHGGWTVLARMRAGRPIVVHGDGTSLWTLTHHTDFARGFVPLLGNPLAIGEAFHITSDDVLCWNQIAGALADAAGVTPTLVHVTSDAIAADDADWGASLLGDKTHSMVFDNSKIRSLAPDFGTTIRYPEGARETVAWYDADPARQVVDADHDAQLDRLVARFG